MTISLTPLHSLIILTVRVRKMKEPGNFAEAAAVERGGWAAEDSDEEKP